jgi:hypothetical protein
MRRLMIPAMALLFILPALACGSTTGSGGSSGGSGSGGAASAAPLSQGQTASVKNWDVTVVGVERPGKELVWSQFNNRSTAAGEWLIAVVRMKNTGGQNFGVNTFDFELTAGGAKYNVSTDGGALTYSQFKGGQNIGGQVPPGVEVTYYVVFDVAPGAANPVLTFKQDKRPQFALP